MISTTYAPNRIFEFVKDGTVPVESIWRNLAAASVNQLVIAGTAGKRIRVVGMMCQSFTAAGNLVLLNGSAGATKFDFNPPLDAPFLMPLHVLGYFELSTGSPLHATVNTNTVNFLIEYIVYTP